jgi:outer membrane protein assembly factor BamB
MLCLAAPLSAACDASGATVPPGATAPPAVPPAGAAHVATGRGTRPAPAPAPSACGPVRRAFAAEVSDTGRVIWQVKLPTDPAQSGIALRPLVIGDEAVFAEENAVYALRLRDGRLLWRRAFYPFPKPDPFASMVYGLWHWRGSVVALIGQASGSARLTSLDASTGAVRWMLRLPHQGLLGSQAMTADGVLAMLVPNGVVEAADLTTGKLLWSRRNGTSPGPVTGSTIIAAGSNARVIGYNGRTGTVRWTARGLPSDTMLTSANGLVLVQSAAFGSGLPTAVTALMPRTGRVAWRFDPGVAVNILGSGPAGIVMSTYNPDRVYLVNPATGRARWTVAATATYLFPYSELVATATNVVLVEGRGAARVVNRRAADGKVLWSAALPGSLVGLHLALTPGAPGASGTSGTSAAAGPDVVVTMGPPGAGTVSRLWVFRLGSGRLAGSTALLTLVQAPLAVAGGDTLVQLDDPAMCGIPLAGAATAAHSSLPAPTCARRRMFCATFDPAQVAEHRAIRSERLTRCASRWGCRARPSG